MIRHLMLVGLRLVLAAVIAAALPVSHVCWGASPEAAGIDGPQAMGLLVAIAAVGLVLGGGCLLIASLVHIAGRRRPRLVLGIDLALGAAALAWAAFAGVTATYAGVP
jgi:MFS family permease